MLIPVGSLSVTTKLEIFFDNIIFEMYKINNADFYNFLYWKLHVVAILLESNITLVCDF